MTELVNQSTTYCPEQNNTDNNSEIEGLFGCHITIINENHNIIEPSLEQIEIFKQLCNEQLKCKSVLIDYPSEYNRPKELMTSSYHFGNYNKVLKIILNNVEIIKNNNFKILRVKLEAMANCKNLKEFVLFKLNNEDNLNNHFYFEYHTNIIVKNNEILQKLDNFIKNNKCVRSRNLQSRNFSENKYSLTLRWFITKENIITKEDCNNLHLKFLEKLRNEFNEDELEVMETEKEFAVYDTNLEVDKGWAPISATE
ncbi:hypothetical protein ABK040_008468 [Willaertia magna]